MPPMGAHRPAQPVVRQGRLACIGLMFRRGRVFRTIFYSVAHDSYTAMSVLPVLNITLEHNDARLSAVCCCDLGNAHVVMDM
jgi:hypothetical protein